MLRASSKGSFMRHRDFGLLVCDQHRATPGLTLFSPLNGKATYVIGLRGDVLHQWAHPLVNGTYAYLLENGNLFWTGRLPEGPQHMGGRGGLFREYDWSGTPELGQALANLIPGARYQTMVGLGHFPMSENPERFLSVIRPVLERIANQSAS